MGTEVFKYREELKQRTKDFALRVVKRYEEILKIMVTSRKNSQKK